MPAMSDRLTKLTAFFERDPTDAFAAYGIAMEHRKAGTATEALIWLDRAIGIDPDHAYAHYQKAIVLEESGETEKARQTIEAGLAAAERSGDSHAAEELRTLAAGLA